MRGRGVHLSLLTGVVVVVSSVCAWRTFAAVERLSELYVRLGWMNVWRVAIAFSPAYRFGHLALVAAAVACFWIRNPIARLAVLVLVLLASIGMVQWFDWSRTGAVT